MEQEQTKKVFMRTHTLVAALLAGVTLTLSGCSQVSLAPSNTYEAPAMKDGDLSAATKIIKRESLGSGSGVTVTDISGLSRAVAPTDKGWRICTQSVKPGAPLSRTEAVELGVVKASESCPDAASKNVEANGSTKALTEQEKDAIEAKLLTNDAQQIIVAGASSEKYKGYTIDELVKALPGKAFAYLDTRGDANSGGFKISSSEAKGMKVCRTDNLAAGQPNAGKVVVVFLGSNC